MNSFKKLAKKLKLEFKSTHLLEKALTHRSFLNENKKIKESNERLEFLGDAVLELVVSSFLFNKYPQKSEGYLTSLRSKIVQTKTLAAVSKKLKVHQYLLLSKGEKESGGQTNKSILADTFEALIGAIFIDQGLKKSSQFIKNNLLRDLKEILSSKEILDYKSQYQEIVQSRGLPTPVYKILSESGPDHNKTFKSVVLVEGEIMAQGIGKSKQTAQQNAAKAALEKTRKKR